MRWAGLTASIGFVSLRSVPFSSWYKISVMFLGLLVCAFRVSGSFVMSSKQIYRKHWFWKYLLWSFMATSVVLSKLIYLYRVALVDGRKLRNTKIVFIESSLTIPSVNRRSICDRSVILLSDRSNISRWGHRGLLKLLRCLDPNPVSIWFYAR